MGTFSSNNDEIKKIYKDFFEGGGFHLGYLILLRRDECLRRRRGGGIDLLDLIALKDSGDGHTINSFKRAIHAQQAQELEDIYDFMFALLDVIDNLRSAHSTSAAKWAQLMIKHFGLGFSLVECEAYSKLRKRALTATLDAIISCENYDFSNEGIQPIHKLNKALVYGHDPDQQKKGDWALNVYMRNDFWRFDDCLTNLKNVQAFYGADSQQLKAALKEVADDLTINNMFSHSYAASYLRSDTSYKGMAQDYYLLEKIYTTVEVLRKHNPALWQHLQKLYKGDTYFRGYPHQIFTAMLINFKNL